MFFSSGSSNYQIAIFHLFNHAFFKASLFLGAGSIIHAIIDEQDIRKMGKFLNYLPFTYICIFIGSLAIIGFPFLTGFYSKDIISELAFTRYSIDGMYIYILSIMAAFFTSVYSTRSLLFIFYGKINNYFISFSRLHECSIKMLISIFILAVFSISIGSISKDYFIGMGTPFWGDALFQSVENFCYIDIHFLPPIIKNLPLLFTLLGILLVYLNLKLYKKFKNFFSLVNITIWVNFIFNAGLFNNSFNNLFNFIYYLSYYWFTKSLDKGYIEFFGPYGFYLLFNRISAFVKYISPFSLFLYILYIFLSVFFLIFFFCKISNFLYFLTINLGLYLILFIVVSYECFD